ncbi:ThiF family adenylyltransferase [Cellulomonas oligotrophica]|uniref:Adenylyltransferase/sulfurtransferase n=1 Tax=Cellulomonas oligotrophica TaxID=931536 RepID=A0A7Y9FCA1_9CELL|nr:ThiF family adenylyltransferase [Cellulomonas oligotrophica]NYD84615.1 adenylyltransferase/sulfurtransferase [Cellulomonas oligotrophica]GIG31682.1 putative adenylyltransferase/sulfurtransferase MoeZ [Cellulomonas oligotrophica]
MSAAPAARPGPLVAPGPALTAAQVERYARHLALDEVGETGQRRLLAARVLVVGAGGLGSPVLLYLAAAGVGTLGVVDDDVVDVSNLQRQVLHGTADVGRRKVDSAADAVRALDPALDVRVHPVRLDASTARDVLAGYDLVVDGSDNFATRYLLNDVCAELGLPWVWGSLQRGHAQVATFWTRPPAGAGVDLRDVFGEAPPDGAVPSCAQDGVLGVVCAAAGAAMAMEVVRLVCGTGRSLLGRVAVHDAFDGTWRDVPVRRDPARAVADPVADPVPGTAPGPAPGTARVPAAPPAPRTAAPAAPARTIGADELAAMLAARDAGTLALDVVDVRDRTEFVHGSVPGARHVPLEAFVDGSALLDVPDDRTLVVVCRVGSRSAHAAALARAAGVRDVHHLHGGLAAWRAGRTVRA